MPNLQSPLRYAHISTATTTTVKSGPGYLESITVNTVGVTAPTITVYDNTAASGQVIAIFSGLTTGPFTYGVGFNTGLTIVTAGATAADITVSYQ
jgi:hypothetical protein